MSKDRWAGKPLQLTHWQHDLIDRLFGTGTYLDDGFFKRQYKTCSTWISKKNGKSSLMAAIAIYLALEKRGNELVIISPTIRQSNFIFNEAKYMVETHPSLKPLFKTRDHKKLIECKLNNSTIQIYSCSPNVSGFNGDVILDEFAEFPPSIAAQVWNKVQKAGAVRLNPLILTISTANHYMGEHPGYQQYLFCKEVQKQPDLDKTLLPIIYECPDSEWETEEGWKKANPSIGYTLDIEVFRDEYTKIKSNHRAINAFKMFSLGIWCGAAEQYIPESDYRAAEIEINESLLHNLRGIQWGLDLSRRRDLTAYVILVPHDGLLYLMPRIFTPESSLDAKSRQDKVDYRKWVEQGFIIATPGDTISQEDLLPHMLADAKLFPPDEVRYDPWNADLLAQALRREGINAVEAPANKPSFMAPATAELERQFHKGVIRVPKNPCMAWNFSNAVIKQIGADNIIVNKSACTARVDTAVASILAISGWMANQDVKFASVDWLV